jgi:hypothetical protein
VVQSNFLRVKKDKGQAVLETAFVFSMILILTFAVVNLGVMLHTKMVATYAAFMSARSYQVFGDQTGAEFFDEQGANDSAGASKDKRLLSDLGKTVTALRVAEDIFTCSLPWMKVPDGDAQSAFTAMQNKNDSSSRCMEGKRKYEITNIGKSIKFAPFEKDSKKILDKPQLNEVVGAYSEKGRKPMRYGILSIKYRTPILFNPMNVFGTPVSSSQFDKTLMPLHSGSSGDLLLYDEVFVPVLLNPGLSEGLSKPDPTKKAVDDDFKK